MKLFVTVLCLSMALCYGLPVNNVQQNTLEAVDAAVQGDGNVEYVRIARQFGYGGLGGYGGYGGFPGGGYGGYPGGGYGGYPGGGFGRYPGGYRGGYGGASASASASASAGGFGK